MGRISNIMIHQLKPKLGYASNFQEFAFVDNVGVDTVGVTIIDWYGDQGILAGFELYQMPSLFMGMIH